MWETMAPRVEHSAIQRKEETKIQGNGQLGSGEMEEQDTREKKRRTCWV